MTKSVGAADLCNGGALLLTRPISPAQFLMGPDWLFSARANSDPNLIHGLACDIPLNDTPLNDIWCGVLALDYGGDEC